MDTYQMTFGDNLTQISLHYGYVRTYIYKQTLYSWKLSNYKNKTYQ